MSDMLPGGRSEMLPENGLTLAVSEQPLISAFKLPRLYTSHKTSGEPRSASFSV